MKKFTELLDDYEIGFGEGASARNLMSFFRQALASAKQEGIEQERSIGCGERHDLEMESARADERKKVVEDVREKVERIKLDMDVVICDCGKPYKGTDPANLVDELLSALLSDKPIQK